MKWKKNPYSKHDLVISCFSWVQFFVTLWTVAHQLLCSWDSPGRNTGVGCHTLLPRIFSTRGLNPRLSCLLHWQAGSLPLVPPGEPSSTLRVFISPNHLINPVMLPGHVHEPHFINEKWRLLGLQCLDQGMCLVRAEPGLAPGVVNFTSALICVCERVLLGLYPVHRWGNWGREHQ